MAKKRLGRPKKPAADRKGRYLQVRVDAVEKAAFDAAAKLLREDLSTWVRTRLRDAARIELERAGAEVPFMAGHSQTR